MMQTSSAAVEYVAHGWALVPLTRDKRPAREGWQQRAQTITCVEDAAMLKGNIGIAHAYSGTACIDIDDYDVAEKWFRERDIELAELMGRPDAVMISSGRAGRGKLLYRAPTQDAPLPTRKPVPGLELRCASRAGLTVQDVLPPSIHPTTGKPYVWAGAGDWRKLPLLPREVWLAWTAPEERTVSEATVNGPVGLSDDALKHLLQARDPDCGYDEWIKTGMALHHECAGEPRGLDLWDEWSATGGKYQGRDDLTGHWDSFGRTDGPSVTIRSLMGNGASQASPEEFDIIVEGIEAEAADTGNPASEQNQRLIPIGDYAQRPAPEWLIKGVLPQAGLAVIFGEPGSGKSFLAFDLAGCLARGVDWNGHRVRAPGRVAYVAAEGAGGMTLRARAYASANPAIIGSHFNIYPGALDLLTTGHRQLAKMIDATGGADLIVVDTLAQSMPGGNENASEDMGKVIANCGKLHRATGALVLLVHHSGKDASRGARGWSGLRGAADAELEVTRDYIADSRRVRVGKQKDAADGGEFPFALQPIDLGRDTDGDALSSCVVEYLSPAAVKKDRGPKGTKQQLALAIIRECAALDDEGTPVATVLTEIARRSPEEEPAKARGNGRRALEGLAAAGWIEVLDNVVRLV